MFHSNMEHKQITAYAKEKVDGGRLWWVGYTYAQGKWGRMDGSNYSLPNSQFSLSQEHNKCAYFSTYIDADSLALDNTDCQTYTLSYICQALKSKYINHKN